MIWDRDGKRLLIRRAVRVLTKGPQGSEGPLGRIEDADVLLKGGSIAAVSIGLRAARSTRMIDARGKIGVSRFVDLQKHIPLSSTRHLHYGTVSE